MKVRCKKCREEISGANIDLTRNIAKCDACGEVFNCQDQLADISSLSSSQSFQSRPEIPMPKGVDVKYNHGGLVITRKWFTPAIFALLFFCVFWDGFMIVWYTIAIMKQQWAMAAFGTIHAMVGIGLTYFTVCGFVNRTEITVTHGKIAIVHLPLPVPGSKESNSAEISQLYSERSVSHSRNGTSISYRLRAQTIHGKDLKLIENLPQQEHALYLEQQIERYLGISDAPVAQEVERF